VWLAEGPSHIVVVGLREDLSLVMLRSVIINSRYTSWTSPIHGGIGYFRRKSLCQFEFRGNATKSGSGGGGVKNEKSLLEKYEKKTPHEHVLLRPGRFVCRRQLNCDENLCIG
jgi:hypothetical protein